MKVTHRKSALLGAVAAGLTVASVAAAGSGVGGIFNLGEVNTVDAKTSLVGSTDERQLEVVNNSSGPLAGAIAAVSNSPDAPALRAENNTSGFAPAIIASSGLGTAILSTTVDGVAVRASHGGATTFSPAIEGETSSEQSNAAAVLGRASKTSPVGDTIGVRGENKSTTALGHGVLGTHDGSGSGVRGTSATGTGVSGSSPLGPGVSGSGHPGVYGAGVLGGSAGVHGHAGAGSGVLGQSNSGSGVVGIHLNATGTEPGVSGTTNSTDADAVGVLGSSGGAYPGATGFGVFGRSNGGTGVFGAHTDWDGTQPGVRGDTNAGAAYAVGVLGRVTSTNAGLGSAAVRGTNKGTGANGVGVWGSQDGSGWGVNGETPSGIGVRGVSSNGTGAYGASTNGTGVFGEHTGTTGTEAGVRGDTNSEDPNAFGVLGRVASTTPGSYSAAVRGRNKGVGSLGIGVWGSHDGSGWGVYGQAAGGAGVRGESTSGIGVYGKSTYSWAGYFSGNVHVAGTLSKAAGSFMIDHPLDPKNKLLSHSFVESPEMMNVYNGNVVTDANGVAVVRLPNYFQALNRDFRYQLTPIGKFAQAIVAKEIDGNRFTIRTDKPNVKVSWQVTGVREDRYAQANRIQVEQAKPKAKRGTYLHPELYRQR